MRIIVVYFENENYYHLLLSKNRASECSGQESLNYMSARVARIVPAIMEERQNNFQKFLKK